jgi:hypothetical protein
MENLRNRKRATISLPSSSSRWAAVNFKKTPVAFERLRTADATGKILQRIRAQRVVIQGLGRLRLGLLNLLKYLCASAYLAC